MRKGHPVYVADQVARGRPGFNQAIFNNVRAGSVAPANQPLIVTSGTGWVQREGGPKQEIREGDIVWTPPGVKHWHGATTERAMTHVAISEALEGSQVTWTEEVSEQEYRR